MAQQTFSTGRFVTLGAFTCGDKRTVFADEGKGWETTVANGTTDAAKELRVKVSALQVVGLWASGDCKIETNNGTTPTDTINLKANLGIVWFAGEANCPFTADCTTVYITNTSGSAVTVRAIIGDNL